MARTHKAAGAQMRALGGQGTPFVTHDSFKNFLARIGIGADNLQSAATYGFDPITRNRVLLEFMYRGSWMVGQAVDVPADDMTREGITIHSDLPPDTIDELQRKMQVIGVWEKVNETIKWSRLYGGALSVVMIDGQDTATPLQADRVGTGEFGGLLVLDRWMVQPSFNDLVGSARGDKFTSHDWGKPRFYETIQAPGLPRLKIHYSRCLRLEGVPLPFNQRLAENLWGMSVVERLYDRMVAFDSTTNGAAQLAHKAHLRTYAVKQLRQILANGGKPKEALLEQINMIRAMQTNEGITLLDSDDTFEAYNYTFAGLAELILQFGQQLSGALGIPLVRLFGQSPAGLNSTGESDMRNYYDNIKKEQERALRRFMRIVLQIILRSEFSQDVPRGFDFTFTPLWQLDDKAKSDINNSVSNAVVAVYGAALISQKTALMELRASSRVTGVWSNITDEDINAADDQPPEMNELMGGDEDEGNEKTGQPGEGDQGDEAGDRELKEAAD